MYWRLLGTGDDPGVIPYLAVVDLQPGTGEHWFVHCREQCDIDESISCNEQQKLVADFIPVHSLIPCLLEAQTCSEVQQRWSSPLPLRTHNLVQRLSCARTPSCVKATCHMLKKASLLRQILGSMFSTVKPEDPEYRYALQLRMWMCTVQAVNTCLKRVPLS